MSFLLFFTKFSTAILQTDDFLKILIILTVIIMKGGPFMFNSVNNPFNKKIESSTSSDKNKQQHQREQKKEEKKYLEQEEQDEVKIGGLPLLTEDEVLMMTKSYINNLKNEHEENKKVIDKLDKFLEKFDVQKFMKKNPNMTSPDFYMVIYNETEGLVK